MRQALAGDRGRAEISQRLRPQADWRPAVIAAPPSHFSASVSHEAVPSFDVLETQASHARVWAAAAGEANDEGDLVR